MLICVQPLPGKRLFLRLQQGHLVATSGRAIDPFHVTLFCGRSLGGGRKIPLTASLTLAMKSVSLFFNNNWRNSDFTCICKGCIPAYSSGTALFEKVKFNGRNWLTRGVFQKAGYVTYPGKFEDKRADNLSFRFQNRR